MEMSSRVAPLADPEGLCPKLEMVGFCHAHQELSLVQRESQQSTRHCASLASIFQPNPYQLTKLPGCPAYVH